MKQRITLTVNGDPVDFQIDPRKSLLDLLRDDVGLTGTKKGCDSGDCGACTVLLDGLAVPSCLVLAVDANGRNVTTVEGLAQAGNLHPVQRAFVDHWAVQCGFCTPGMIIAAVALLAENPHPTPEEARAAIAGNLCRCTGYAKIVEAIVAAGNE